MQILFYSVRARDCTLCARRHAVRLGLGDSASCDRREAGTDLCIRMQRYVPFSDAGTIRKLQHKAIAIDKHYILRLENAKERAHAAPPPDVVMANQDWSAVDDDDLGMRVDEEPDEDQKEAAGPDEHLGESEPVSSATAKLLAQSRSDIMNISN